MSATTRDSVSRRVVQQSPRLKLSSFLAAGRRPSPERSRSGTGDIGGRQARFSFAGGRQLGAERSKSAKPLCSPLPASFSHRPHPPRRFVENKSQTPIRPSGHRAVEALFPCFSGLQSGSISALFSRFYCPVGRGSQRAGASVLADC